MMSWIKNLHNVNSAKSSSKNEVTLKSCVRLEYISNIEMLAFNTQYMRNPDIICVLKMEHVSKVYTFGLKMMVKSGLEKIFLRETIFPYFIKVSKITNSVIKMTW